MLNNRSTRGALLCIFSASLWGFTGTVGQFLFQEMGVSSKWLASNRMFAAGILLLLYIYWRRGKEIFSIWKNKKEAKDMLLFSLIGMLFTQYGIFLPLDIPTPLRQQYCSILPLLRSLFTFPYAIIKCLPFSNSLPCFAHCSEHSYWQPMEM